MKKRKKKIHDDEKNHERMKKREKKPTHRCTNTANMQQEHHYNRYIVHSNSNMDRMPFKTAKTLHVRNDSVKAQNSIGAF